MYKFNFKDGVNIETVERPSPMGIAFNETDSEAALTPHNDPVVVLPILYGFKIS